MIRAEDVAATLERGRRNAEVRMTETVQVGVFKDDTDEVSGDAIHVLVEEHYEGKARIKYESLTASDSDSSSQVVAAQTPMLSVPVTTSRLPDGDGVKVTASTSDGILINRFYTIKGAPQAGQTTSHRYPLRELS